MEKLFDPKTLAALGITNLAAVVFGGGIMYAQFQEMRGDIADLQVRSQVVTPAAGERLARIEAVLTQMDARQREMIERQTADNQEIKRRLERLEERR